MTRGLGSPCAESIENDGHMGPCRRDSETAVAGVGPKGAWGMGGCAPESFWRARTLQGRHSISEAWHASVWHERPWSLVLKVLGPAAGPDDPTHIDYWKRELLLYSSGLLDDLPAGLCAPRCYGCDEPMDGVVWLWLEHVRGGQGPGVAARARWGARGATLGAIQTAPTLSGGRFRAHPGSAGSGCARCRNRHHSLVAQIAKAPGKTGGTSMVATASGGRHPSPVG